MTDFERLHAHFLANAPELGNPPNISRLVRIIGANGGTNADRVTYGRYLSGRVTPGPEALQGYAARWNASGHKPVGVVGWRSALEERTDAVKAAKLRRER